MKTARFRLEPATFRFTDLPEWEVGALLIWPPQLLCLCPLFPVFPSLPGWLLVPPECTVDSVPLSDWLAVCSVCTVDRQLDRQGAHTYGHWGPSVPHWGGVNCTFRGHRQLVKQGAPTGADWGSQLYIQRAQTKSDMGHTGAVNCTYRGHRQPVR